MDRDRHDGRSAPGYGTLRAELQQGLNIVRDGMALALGNSSAIVLQTLAGVLTARFLLPRELGLFNGIGLAVGYASLLQLGIINGLNRELPVLWGRSQEGEAQRLAQTTLAFSLGLGTLIFVSFLGIGVWQLALGKRSLGLGWSTFAFVGAAVVLGDHYYPTLYKTTGRFKALARITTLRSLLNFLLVLLVALMGYVGLCLKAVGAATANLLLLARKQPLPFRPAWWSAGLRRLLKVGFPIFVVGQLASLWILGNNTLVLKILGPRGFGLFSVVLVVGNLATVLPIGIGQVVYPKMARSWGRGVSERELINLARVPTAVSLLVSIPAIVAGWLLLPVLIRWALPRYVEAIEAARWALLTGITASLTPVNNIFNVLGRQRLYGAALLTGMVAHGGCLLFMAARWPTLPLTSFVQALLVGQLVMVLVSYLILFALFFVGSPKAGEG